MREMRVLFLGNSHTFYNDMPQIFKMLCEESGTFRVDVGMQAHPGVTFGWHLSQRSELRFGLLYGGYDYLIMQQAAHSPCPSKAETVADGTEIIKLARAAGVTPVITIPWAEKRFPEHQKEMYQIYSELAGENGAKFSPVGQVFERVLKEHPEIDLYWLDGEHCSPYGSYVVAATVFSRLFEKSPVGLPGKSICNMTGTPEDMRAVQRLMDAARADMENKELMEEVWAQYRSRFTLVNDPAKIKVDLEPEKCRVLQEMIWEEVSKIL